MASGVSTSGTAPKLDLLLAQTERSAAEQELALAGQAYATARIALATLLDHAGDFEGWRGLDP